MAQLFGKGTIKENVVALSWFDESKIEKVTSLYQDWKAGNMNDEVKYKETFNQVFFWDLLWYENRIHRIPEWTIPGIGNADITLWNFSEWRYEIESVQVVCELKWAKSNLTKKQNWHGGLSPVGQGFAYKTGLKNCKWLIVSNFYETRLYRDNQTDFESWTLDELMDPKDNYFNLRKLYLLLHRNNLISWNWASKTENLLSHFRDEQQIITKEFYDKYKKLRIELINDMKHRNVWVSIEILIEKAQKIIDRLIFIFFCEDKGLLPEKKLKENILRSWEAGFTPWEITKKFFLLVDKWSDKLGIPHWYNWWLFKEDSELDSLNVGDDICNKFVNLTNYDFDDELSVNVLGHIFEQSISDLEKLKVELLGHIFEIDTLTEKWNSKWRRKKDGIFYTPEYIVDYIVQNSVMTYLNEKEDECLKKYKNDEIKGYQAYQQILQNIKVLDPACGSGAFLVRVFDVLLEENKRVWSILNSLFDESTIYKNILTNNIYGVDLNEESVEITKLSLWLKSAQKDKKLNNLDGNIKCGNSLIDDVFVAREKAFDWNVQFKEIMKDGGFDVIVGNPPYVDIIWIDRDIRKYFEKNYKTAVWRFDLYSLFIEKWNILLKNNGYLSFIIPKKYLNNIQFQTSRSDLSATSSVAVCIIDDKVFEEASVDSTIIFAHKQKDNRRYLCYDVQSNKIVIDKPIKFLEDNNYIFRLETSDNLEKLLRKIKENTVLVKDIWEVKDWIVAWEIKDILYLDKPIDNYSKPLLFWKDLSRYFCKKATNWVNYKPEEMMQEEKNRKNGKRIGLWMRDEKIFLRKKIITRFVWTEIVWWIDSNQNYYEHTLHSTCIYDNNFLIEYILCLYNSKLLNFYYKKINSKSGKIFPQIRISSVENLPIKEISLSAQDPFVEKAHKMLSLNKDFHELVDKFLNRIQDNLKIEKLTKKLESFYELEFKDFLIELKKQKVSLSLAQQDEREPYFREYKEKILALKNEIDKTDKEIDGMVFDLYGLNEEERKVVLGG